MSAHDRSRDELHAQICDRIREHAAHEGRAFENPPATLEQVHAAEQRLGFPLHRLLRKIALEVANGGDLFFLRGRRSMSRLEEIAGASASGWRLNERVARGLEAFPGTWIDCERLPDGFVGLRDLGCGITAAWDRWSGRVYQCGAGEPVYWYRIGLGLQPGESLHTLEYTSVISCLAPSMEDYFLRQCSDVTFHSIAEDGNLTPAMVALANGEVDSPGD